MVSCGDASDGFEGKGFREGKGDYSLVIKKLKLLLHIVLQI